jgi:uncharacterized membrane protein YdjX (TVP38/TMEM64 family)
MMARARGAAAVYPASARQARTARALVFVLLALGATAAWHWRAILDPLAITTVIEGYPAAPLAFLGIHIAASLLFVPRTMLAIVAGLLFGMGWGILWAEIGSVAGAAAGFLLARYINSGLVDVERTARIRPVLERVERGGWRAVALLRLIPIMPHSLTNYGLGLTRLSLSAYAFGSLIGQLPMTIAYVDLGAAGGQLILGRAGWLEPSLIGLAALSVSVAIPAYSRWRGRAKQPSMPSAEGLL